MIVLIILLLGSTPVWPYSKDWGYGPFSGLGMLLIVLVILLLLGYVHP